MPKYDSKNMCLIQPSQGSSGSRLLKHLAAGMFEEVGSCRGGLSGRSCKRRPKPPGEGGIDLAGDALAINVEAVSSGVIQR